jgi:amino acid transporter
MTTFQPPEHPVQQMVRQDHHGNTLSAFGYKQELRRTLRFFSLFSVAFSIVSISTGIFLNYGFAINEFGGASIWTWPAVAAGQIVMALLIAELSTKIPLAGYAYQWGARLVGSVYGWYTGFFGLLYMSITGGAIVLLGATPLLLNAIGVDNPSGHLVLAIALVILVATIMVNIIGVQIASRVNNTAVIAEIAGTVLFAVLLITVWGSSSRHGGGVDNLTSTLGTAGGATWYRFALAGLLGIYTMVGFELSADLTEEAVDSQRAVPRAILTGVTGSAVLGMLALICFTIAMPDLKTTQSAALPLVTIGDYWLPHGLVRVLIAIVAFSMIALVVANQAAQARLLFSMGRDNMLPFSSLFRSVNEKTRTPVMALIIGGVVSVAFMVYGYLQSNSFGTLVGSTSIAPYIVYLLIVGSYMRRRSTLSSVRGGFGLGPFGPPLMVIGLLWVVLALLILTLPAPFHGADKVIGGGAVLAILWHVLVLRGRIKRGQAGVERFDQTAVGLDLIESGP